MCNDYRFNEMRILPFEIGVLLEIGRTVRKRSKDIINAIVEHINRCDSIEEIDVEVWEIRNHHSREFMRNRDEDDAHDEVLIDVYRRRGDRNQESRSVEKAENRGGSIEVFHECIRVW